MNDDSQTRVYRPWGWYHSVDRGECFQVKRLVANPGEILSLQLHNHRIDADLRVGGTISTSYWKAFLSNFDPSMVLEQSRWEVGYMQPERAELVLTYKRLSKPAYSQMFTEGADWKVGLVETFWRRK